MARFGYDLTCEEHDSHELVAMAMGGEEAGFDFLSVSDHFHPWQDSQGESPFSWSVLGAIAAMTERVGLVSAVVCPTRRYHPAIVAQAAATVQQLSDDRYTLGVGSGEALNEHVVGGEWPAASVRQEMLAEAVGIIRELWDGGQVTHRGRWFTVDRARLYSRPQSPPGLLIAAGGSSAARRAGELDAGIIAIDPDPDLVAAYREAGGNGEVHGQLDVCWDPDPDTARKTAWERWRYAGLGFPAIAELPTPASFDTASSSLPADALDELVVIGPDVGRIVERVGQFVDAGFDHVSIHQVGDRQQDFLDVARDDLLPRLRERYG